MKTGPNKYKIKRIQYKSNAGGFYSGYPTYGFWKYRWVVYNPDGTYATFKTWDECIAYYQWRICDQKIWNMIQSPDQRSNQWMKRMKLWDANRWYFEGLLEWDE